jgi:hypothetical protein
VVQPWYSRGTAEAQPRYSQGTAKVQPKKGRHVKIDEELQARHNQGTSRAPYMKSFAQCESSAQKKYDIPVKFGNNFPVQNHAYNILDWWKMAKATLK